MPQKTLCDRRGVPVSTRSPVAVERYDEGVELMLSGNLGPLEKLQQAIAADEGFALALHVLLS